MANDNEPAKLLLPYLQRADELQKHDPLVAYYCRLYAMERGLKFPQSERTKTTNNLLISLMKQLEKDKKSLKLGPDDQLHLEGFALNVFEKADKQDRAGRANLNTAKTFYAASIFFEILNQFSELQPDLEQKQKYAAWKAADIRKAIKEGREPVPGPPGGEDDFSIPATTSSGEHDIEPSLPGPPTESALPHPPSQFHDESNRQYKTDYPSPPSNYSPPAPPPSNYSPPAPPPSNYSPPAPPTSNYSPPAPPPSNYSPPAPPPSNHSPPALSPSPTSNYPSHDIHPSQNIRSENTFNSESFHHQPYQQFPQNYPSHESPSYTLPNFQSYPSFTETTLPTAPSHYPSHYQASDSSYPNPGSGEYNIFATPQNETAVSSKSHPHISAPAATISNQNIYTQANNNAPAHVQKFEYDSHYQPSPEKIAEAHKAARFAVGALAFDDVATAVDFLTKSLELLTNPAVRQ